MEEESQTLEKRKMIKRNERTKEQTERKAVNDAIKKVN